MSTTLTNLSVYDPATIPSGENTTVGIVVAEYNEQITFALRDGCVETLLKHGVTEDNIVIEYVPGAFELPLAAQMLYIDAECDAVIVLGCVIKGDTDHDVYINQAVSQAIMTLNLEFESPFIFGLLTPNTLEQALDRAGGKHGNKGVECAIAALKMMDLQLRLGEDDSDFDSLN